MKVGRMMGVNPGYLQSNGLNPLFKCKRCRQERTMLGQKARVVNGKQDGFICDSKSCTESK